MSTATGTVAFLLCDIEGSTRLVHETGPDYATILNGVRRILREAVTRHEGAVIDAHGDELFAAFASLDDAVAAAVDSQRALIEETWPGERDVRVRMGVHVGQPLVTEDGYTGIDVHRAARIGSAGHGGQILLSATACCAARRSPFVTSGATASPACRSPSTSTSSSRTGSRATSRRSGTRSRCSATR